MSIINNSANKKFTGHRAGDKVRSLAWNADGRRLASGGSDKALRIWTPEKDSRTSTEMKGHLGDVTKISWDPLHPEHLSSCSANMGDRAVYFWDIRQGKPTSSIQTQGENINMSYSPDGKTLVLGSRTDLMTWIDVDTKRIIKEEKMKDETNEFIFSHSGSLLFIALGSNIQINTFPDCSPVHSIRVSPVSNMAVDLDPKGRYLAVGSNDAMVTLWETTEWTCVRSMGHFEGALRAVTFSYDGQMLASGSEDPFITITGVPTGQQLHKIETGASTSALAWHPNKPILAYACEELERGSQNGAFRITTVPV